MLFSCFLLHFCLQIHDTLNPSLPCTPLSNLVLLHAPQHLTLSAAIALERHKARNTTSHVDTFAGTGAPQPDNLQQTPSHGRETSTALPARVHDPVGDLEVSATRIESQPFGFPSGAVQQQMGVVSNPSEQWREEPLRDVSECDPKDASLSLVRSRLLETIRVVLHGSFLAASIAPLITDFLTGRMQLTCGGASDSRDSKPVQLTGGREGGGRDSEPMQVTRGAGSDEGREDVQPKQLTQGNVGDRAGQPVQCESDSAQAEETTHARAGAHQGMEELRTVPMAGQQAWESVGEAAGSSGLHLGGLQAEVSDEGWCGCWLACRPALGLVGGLAGWQLG